MRWLLILLLSLPCMGQVIQLPYFTVTGNSFGEYQAGFAHQEFPTMPVGDVNIFGQDGFTCANIEQMITGLVPKQTTVVAIYGTTNDAKAQTPIASLVGCMTNIISILTARNPSIKIVITNTPPWTQDNCLNLDRRDLIDQYNAAFLAQQWNVNGANVTLVDVWNPNILNDGSRWGDPAKLADGFCGVHFGPSHVWTDSWEHGTAPVSAAVQALAGRQP